MNASKMMFIQPARANGKPDMSIQGIAEKMAQGYELCLNRKRISRPPAKIVVRKEELKTGITYEDVQKGIEAFNAKYDVSGTTNIVSLYDTIMGAYIHAEKELKHLQECGYRAHIEMHWEAENAIEFFRDMDVLGATKEAKARFDVVIDELPPEMKEFLERD